MKNSGFEARRDPKVTAGLGLQAAAVERPEVAAQIESKGKMRRRPMSACSTSKTASRSAPIWCRDIFPSVNL